MEFFIVLNYKRFVSSLQELSAGNFASAAADGDIYIWNVNGELVSKFSTSGLIPLIPHPQHRNVFAEAAAAQAESDQKTEDLDKAERRVIKKAENQKLCKEQADIR